MQSVKKYHIFYETEDALLVAEEGIRRVGEMIMEDDLDADQLKKASEAFQKFSNQWLALQGRATSITETQKKDSIDLEILDLLNAQRAKNSDVASRDLAEQDQQ